MIANLTAVNLRIVFSQVTYLLGNKVVIIKDLQVNKNKISLFDLSSIRGFLLNANIENIRLCTRCPEIDFIQFQIPP